MADAPKPEPDRTEQRQPLGAGEPTIASKPASPWFPGLSRDRRNRSVYAFRKEKTDGDHAK